MRKKRKKKKISPIFQTLKILIAIVSTIILLWSYIFFLAEIVPSWRLTESLVTSFTIPGYIFLVAILGAIIWMWALNWPKG